LAETTAEILQVPTFGFSIDPVILQIGLNALLAAIINFIIESGLINLLTQYAENVKELRTKTGNCAKYSAFNGILANFNFRLYSTYLLKAKIRRLFNIIRRSQAENYIFLMLPAQFWEGILMCKML
jgi:hypothetical protein